MGRGRIEPLEIYEALFDDQRFAQLPSILASSLNGRSVLIHWHYADGGAQVLAHSGYFTDDQLQDYAMNYAPLDPWAAATATLQKPGEALNLEQFVPAAEFERTAFYNEYIRGMGDDTFRCMGIRANTPSGSGMIAVHRGRGQPNFSPDEVASLQQHALHLHRVLDLRGKIAATDRARMLVEHMLDTMRAAALLLASNGRLIHANFAGERLLGRHRGLLSRRGIVAALDPQDDQRLAKAVSLACSDHPRSSTIVIKRGEWPPLIASVTPVVQPGASRRALVLINAEDLQAGLKGELGRLFRLTLAEAEVAVLLAQGLSASAIADRRKVAVDTIRSQLKSIFLKLGCTRQSDVVALLRAIPLPQHPHRAS